MPKLNHVYIEKNFETPEAREVMLKLMNHERSREIEFKAEESHQHAVKSHRKLMFAVLLFSFTTYLALDHWLQAFGGDHVLNWRSYIWVAVVYAVTYPRRG
jgi:hypothetical protein